MPTGDVMTSEQFLDFVATGQKAQAAVNRVIGGKRAQGGGKDFEKALDYTHARYAAEDRAIVYRLPVNTAPMPPVWLKDPKRSGICRILAERQRADYAGFLPTGRAIVMEAKATTERARSLAISPKAGLKPHQLRALAEAHVWGALAVLVWRNGEDRLVLTGDALVTADRAHRTGSLTRLDRSLFRPYSHDLRTGEDWLSAVLSLEMSAKVT